MAVTVTPKTLQHFSRLSRDQSSDHGRVPAITRQAIAFARVTLTPEEGGAIALADTLHYSARMRKGYAHSTLRRILIGLPIAMLASAPPEPGAAGAQCRTGQADRMQQRGKDREDSAARHGALRRRMLRQAGRQAAIGQAAIGQANDYIRDESSLPVAEWE
ncbi:MAG: hypothetical protein JZU55_19180 [Afipia sp.]|nr:hypothetical protein [Afipia sp.]